MLAAIREAVFALRDSVQWLWKIQEEVLWIRGWIRSNGFADVRGLDFDDTLRAKLQAMRDDLDKIEAAMLALDSDARRSDLRGRGLGPRWVTCARRECASPMERDGTRFGTMRFPGLLWCSEECRRLDCEERRRLELAQRGGPSA